MALSLLNRTGPEGEEMTFVDHLEALRWHIVRSLLAVVVFGIFIFIKMDWVFERVIAGPLQNDFISYILLCRFSHFIHLGDTLCMPAINVKLQAIEFSSQFMSSITIAFVGGFIAAFPYIFWEFWRFIKPALKPSELKSTRGSIFFVSFFFFTGAAFGYFLLGPFTFNFLSNYSLGTTHLLETKPTLNDYLDNLVNIIIGCGLAFELPVLAYVLTKIGLVTPQILASSRKYAIVVILVVAAVITPSPDWSSQMLVFVPLFLLYQLSIVVSKRAYKEMIKHDNEDWS
ncbi:twin-arginine translocase subunit TatC [Segetibacter aerophilus]|uniref:Sec-independent protein translocase protein TatC n=1 Tax=Segetibacter aerophilus TaxID=670293 RepID=A0A512BBH0_9BACT|nr:twin-arginine translocase subunit TatC [Segetibacter aerophilus]GEO09318.1 Sec-independent protein translocase protein TatC [Segetibacter aerophilus]